MTLIAKVEQKGNMVYAYSAGGSMLWARNGRLVNWTSREVAVEEAGSVYIYDENGTRIA